MTGNETSRSLQYGVKVATVYPGTPSSEIWKTSPSTRRSTQWSTNEKVATEAAIGAAYAGRRAITTMKQVGMNVASDVLLRGLHRNARQAAHCRRGRPGHVLLAERAGQPPLRPLRQDAHASRATARKQISLASGWSCRKMGRAGAAAHLREVHSASPVELGERNWDDEALPPKWCATRKIASAPPCGPQRPMIEERRSS